MGQGQSGDYVDLPRHDAGDDGLQATAKKQRRTESSLVEPYLAQKKAEADRQRAEMVAHAHACAEERAMWSLSGVTQVHWSSDGPSVWTGETAGGDEEQEVKSRSPRGHGKLTATSRSLLERRRISSPKELELASTLLESQVPPPVEDPLSPGPRVHDKGMQAKPPGPPRPRLPSEDVVTPMASRVLSGELSIRNGTLMLLIEGSPDDRGNADVEELISPARRSKSVTCSWLVDQGREACTGQKSTAFHSL
mmetsp:Transcript_23537/g.42459  ORF Transcript_23537/g.42459 Transcript_23537/m.42459 type:complete len:251 (+) Transcript_23537:55-807(+)